MSDPFLEIKDLTIHYITEGEVVQAVNNIHLSVKKGESLGLVGETGAGKTTLALGIMQLVPNPPGKVISGSIHFKGKDLNKLPEKELLKYRGNQVSMIFQDPMTSLNPVLTVGHQIKEVIEIHQDLSSKQAQKKMLEMLELVGIMSSRHGEYPHQFSGGMKQRIIIAIALACNPELLIADEPTTALDVTIQAQVLDLMRVLKKQYNTAMIMITHDLGVVAETCDKVAIMYAGEIIEYGTLEDIYNNTKHPYTIGLFQSIPSLLKKVKRLQSIKGLAPNPAALPTGCKFHPRCPDVQDLCSQEEPAMTSINNKEHFVKCLAYQERAVSDTKRES